MQKPFLDHLEDLRWMLIKMAMVLVASMAGAFYFRLSLVDMIQHPLREIDPHLVAKLQVLGVADSITISCSLAFYAGLVICFPFLLYFLAQFVLPALTQKEKKYVFPAVLIGFALFMGGVSFAYFWIIPGTLKFLLHDQERMGWSSNWTVPKYFGFVTHMVMIFGLLFEMPVAMFGLALMGLVTAEFLRKTRIYSYAGLLILAGIVSPSPDLGTFTAIALPMVLLFEGCIWLVWFIERKRRQTLTEE